MLCLLVSASVAHTSCIPRSAAPAHGLRLPILPAFGLEIRYEPLTSGHIQGARGRQSHGCTHSGTCQLGQYGIPPAAGGTVPPWSLNPGSSRWEARRLVSRWQARAFRRCTKMQRGGAQPGAERAHAGGRRAGTGRMQPQRAKSAGVARGGVHHVIEALESTQHVEHVPVPAHPNHLQHRGQLR